MRTERLVWRKVKSGFFLAHLFPALRYYSLSNAKQHGISTDVSVACEVTLHYTDTRYNDKIGFYDNLTGTLPSLKW